MDPSTIPCKKCSGKTFSRLAYTHEGCAAEVYCPLDGWSHVIAVSLLGRPPETPIKRLSAKELHMTEQKQKAAAASWPIERRERVAEQKRQLGIRIRAVFDHCTGTTTRRVLQTAGKLGISDKTVWNYLKGRRGALAFLAGLMLLSGCATCRGITWTGKPYTTACDWRGVEGAEAVPYKWDR